MLPNETKPLFRYKRWWYQLQNSLCFCEKRVWLQLQNCHIRIFSRNDFNIHSFLKSAAFLFRLLFHQELSLAIEFPCLSHTSVRWTSIELLTNSPSQLLSPFCLAFFHFIYAIFFCYFFVQNLLRHDFCVMLCYFPRFCVLFFLKPAF